MELTSLANGLLYLSLYPLLKMKPEFVFKFILLGADYEKYGDNDDVLKSMSSVFIILASVISIPYVYSGIFGHRVYVDISIMQRVTVVFLSVLLTSYVIKQDPFEYNNFQYSMFAIADVFPALISGIRSPGGFAGMKSKLYRICSFSSLQFISIELLLPNNAIFLKSSFSQLQ